MLFAVIYRIGCKEVLLKNLARVKAVERIVADIVSGTEYLTAQLKEDSALLFPCREYLREVYYKSSESQDP